MQRKIGAHIAALRRAQGMTQEQLAAAVGVSAPAVSKWETDSSLPDVALLCPLARALRVSVDTLLRFEQTLNTARLGEEITALMEIFRTEGAQAADERMTALLREYPSDAALKYHLAAVLTMMRMTEPEDSPQRLAQLSRSRELLEAVCAGDSPYAPQAAQQLAALALNEEDADKAEQYLQCVPDSAPDTTALQVRLLLLKGETEAARQLVQKRLYALIQQSAGLLAMMMGKDLEPDPQCALAVGERLAALDALFLHSSMTDAARMEVYLRAGRGEDALVCLTRLAEWFTAPAAGFDPVVFSALPAPAAGRKVLPEEMRRALLNALRNDPALAQLRDEEAYVAALAKLES